MTAIALERETPTILSPEIALLNFSMLKRKIQDGEEGLGWSRELCDDVELDYKRFLALKRHYPDREIVPNKLVDAFWHYHILDTECYSRDCDAIFGYFLHHYPYFGMRGPEDYQNLCDAFDETQQLFEQHFGAEYASGRGRCRTQCKPQRCK